MWFLILPSIAQMPLCGYVHDYVQRLGALTTMPLGN
jgi:hypothetical protein